MAPPAKSQTQSAFQWLALSSLLCVVLYLSVRKFRRLQSALYYPFFRSMVKMPGRSYRGPIASLNPSQLVLRSQLEKRVRKLSEEIGERSIEKYSQMLDAMNYIEDSFEQSGYTVTAHAFQHDEQSTPNYAVEKIGVTQPEKIVIVGAHYDTVPGSPGADDNATGVAAMLEIARILHGANLPYTVRFVAFANEEHPGAGWETMGSYDYARGCSERGENIVAMLSLEMLGFYSTDEGSQRYPEPFNYFYPSVADFIAFVANTRSKTLVERSVASFRKAVQFPCEGLAAPEAIRDVGRSDHWSFWQFGYPAAMVTDTSNFRYAQYHTSEDTPDKLDFDRFTIVVSGITQVICELAGVSRSGESDSSLPE